MASLEELIKKSSQLKQRALLLNQRISTQKRKQETRLKILLGAFFLNELKNKNDKFLTLLNNNKNHFFNNRDLKTINEFLN